MPTVVSWSGLRLEPHCEDQDCQRFFSHLRLQLSGCWEWTRSIDPGGYGKFWVYRGYSHLPKKKKSFTTHRWLYEHTHPNSQWLPCKKWVLDHLCENRRCVRYGPGHVQIATTRENIMRGRRKDACINGHAYTAENTGWVTRSGRHPHRRCRQCDRERHAEAYAARKLSSAHGR